METKMKPTEAHRSIQGYARLVLLVFASGATLLGCRKSAPDPAAARAEAASVEAVATAPPSLLNEGVPAAAVPANPSGVPATVPKPATLAEVREAIDWFNFLKPDGAVWEETDLLTTRYWVPGTVAQAADFHRNAMAAQGWERKQEGQPGSRT